MASEHTVADDIVYDLISIQYHALKGAALYDQYLNDAHSAEHPDVSEFIEHCKREDEQRAIRAHDLLGQLTRKHHLDLEDAEVGGIRDHN
jgi:hypothetical protein